MGVPFRRIALSLSVESCGSQTQRSWQRDVRITIDHVNISLLILPFVFVRVLSLRVIHSVRRVGQVVVDSFVRCLITVS